MRQDVAALIKELWNIMGPYQIHIIPPLVGSFLELLTVCAHLTTRLSSYEIS